jgi:hypothetical protein
MFSGDLLRFGVYTTNGIERQHETLKYKYLTNRGAGSLSTLLTCLVTKFIPDCRRRLQTLCHALVDNCVLKDGALQHSGFKHYEVALNRFLQDLFYV